MTKDSNRWPLDLELVGICGDDYESLEIIRDQLNESYPELSDGEILACLRELQSRGWMNCYNYVIERVAPDPGPEAQLEEKSKQWCSEFVAVAEFADEQAKALWWYSTEAGIKTLKSSKEWNTPEESDDDL